MKFVTLLFTIFCSFPRVKTVGIQESLFMVLNLEREVKTQDREKSSLIVCV